MNTDDGKMMRFVSREAVERAQAKAQAHDGRPHDIFEVGEEVQIKNSWFRIQVMGKKFMTLRILPTLKKEEAE